MKLFQTIRDWLKNIVYQYNEQKKVKRRKTLNKLSCADINVIEFNGRLYIAYQGIPVVRTDDLKIKAPELLSQSRVDYLIWKEMFDK